MIKIHIHKWPTCLHRPFIWHFSPHTYKVRFVFLSVPTCTHSQTFNKASVGVVSTPRMCVPYMSMSEHLHLGKSLVCIAALWRIWHFRSICLLLGRYYDLLRLHLYAEVLLVLPISLHPLACRHSQAGCHSTELRSISICPSISVVFSAVFGAHVDTCSPREASHHPPQKPVIPKPSQAKSSRAKSRLPKKRRSQPESQKSWLATTPFLALWDPLRCLCLHPVCMLHIQYLCNLPFDLPFCPLCSRSKFFASRSGRCLHLGFVSFHFVSLTFSLANSICLLTFATCTLADFILAGAKRCRRLIQFVATLFTKRYKIFQPLCTILFLLAYPCRAAQTSQRPGSETDPFWPWRNWSDSRRESTSAPPTTEWVTRSQWICDWMCCVSANW